MRKCLDNVFKFGSYLFRKKLRAEYRFMKLEDQLTIVVYWFSIDLLGFLANEVLIL
jgi:hypothetical protein